jgi:hypothetical protein
MSDDEQRLIEDARKSREETEKLREESGLEPEAKPDAPVPDDDLPDEPSGEPWAKTSSGDADSVTED